MRREERKTGLVLMQGGHLGYGWGYGAFQGTPTWFRFAIATAWNWVVCHTRGHSTIGPWWEPESEDGRNIQIEGYPRGYYPKTCSACCKRWPLDPSAPVVAREKRIEVSP